MKNSKFHGKEIVKQLIEVFGEDAPCQKTIYNWIREFRSGRESVFDEERCGRPLEVGEEKSVALQKIIMDDRRIPTRELSSLLNVSKGFVHNILKDLGIRRLCSRFVPRFLTKEMMDRRLACCVENLELLELHGDLFMRNIVTEDETPLCLYNPESRRESAEWVFKDGKAPRKMRFGTSHRKCLTLSLFWDINGAMLVDFCDGNINGPYYANLLEKARKFKRRCPNQNIWLLHDNAPVHTSNVAKDQIIKSGFVVIAHPPYSPDLAPSDFWLFNHLKKHLRGNNYNCPEVLQAAVTQFIENCSASFYKNAFLELVKRWKKCVEANGGYVEK